MRRRWWCVGSCLVGLVFLSGCATTGKKSDLEVQGLKNQLSAMESQLTAKDDEITALREALTKAEEEKYDAMKAVKSAESSVPAVAAESKTRFTVREVQTALRNAGFDPGSVDGKMGKKTREAIRAFQRANNLTADGTVGKKTWTVLRGYLASKVK